MSAEYGMLLTVAVIFIPAGLVFYWLSKRDEKHHIDNNHLTHPSR